MRFGLYLKGGGAKGAFQAGLLCAMWQRGVTYSVIAGTSIGAVNGWFALHNAYQELEDLYLKQDKNYIGTKLSGKVVDNSMLIDRVRAVSGVQDPKVDAFYVNYCPVVNGELKEKTENLKGKDREYALERINWSSLLPYNHPSMTLGQFGQYITTNGADVEAKFKQDLENHVYDGLNLDGGMKNNLLIRDVFRHSGERVICIGYNGTREEYLESLSDLAVSDREKILYVASDHPFEVSDTYNFTPQFLKERFQEGYKKGMDFSLLKLISR